jgi:hypothetical protein
MNPYIDTKLLIAYIVAAVTCDALLSAYVMKLVCAC